MSDAPRRLVTINNLTLTQPGARWPALRDVSLTVDAGETVVLLGEAGSGAVTLVRALANPTRARKEKNVPSLDDVRTAYIPNPLSRPLSPFGHAASQLVRAVARKRGMLRMNAKSEFEIALERFPHAPRLPAFQLRPRELSPENIAWGLLAAAMAQNPQLVIVDNAFSGLAPAQAARLMRALLDEQKRLGFAILAATETAETARGLGGRTIVMRDGRIVAEGSVEKLSATANAYTQNFFRPAVSASQTQRALGRGEPVLKTHELLLTNARKSGRNTLSFELRRGNVLALIGDEGSGRRALVRTLLGLERAEKGRVVMDAVDIGILSHQMMTHLRRRVGYIAGDDAMLDPRMSVWHTVEEPLRAHLHLRGGIIANYRDAALKRVGLDTMTGSRVVGSLAPFDKRRLQIARAVVSAPLLVIVDEPFSGLDTVAQGVVCDLLRNFRAQEGPAFLIVTSDVRVAQMLADEAFVMKDRVVIERGPIAELMRAPKDAYTKSFIEASQYPVSGLSPELKQG
jgi:peptide/nickel transport system ATP-binding protein